MFFFLFSRYYLEIFVFLTNQICFNCPNMKFLISVCCTVHTAYPVVRDFNPSRPKRRRYEAPVSLNHLTLKYHKC